MESVLGGTIVARASGPGHSTRAIVRLSGPDALAAVASLMREPGAAGLQAGDSTALSASLRTRGAHRIRMGLEVCGERCTCPALALSMPGPRSFTGEDCVELLVPGHPALADAVVQALLRVPGVSAATPGAFMARAHAAGTIALQDAERIALEIGATHASELEAARGLQSNPLVQAARSATSALAELLARVEAGIDFTDSEDVVAIAAEHLCARARAVRDEVTMWVDGSVPIESVGTVPSVALRGPPNAGKSSLFNALLGRTRAVASPVAGTTRDAIVEELEVQEPGARGGSPAWRVLLVDTPGIEDPRSAIDALMQRQAAVAEGADLVVLCEPLGSPTHPAASPDGRTIRVATRADEVPHGMRPPAEPGTLRTSAVTGEGIAELAGAIASRLASRGGVTSGAQRVGVLARHREAMIRAADWIGRAIGAASAEPGRTMAHPELVADALRGALDALGEVTGEVTPDDVLGLVFSRFCIGK
jgi:tRNA modification GTPase